MTAVRRTFASLLAAGTLAVTAAGCAPGGVVCPAIGWTNEAEVRTTGDAEAVARVAWVRWCDDLACSRSAEEPRDPDASATALEHVAVADGPGTWTVRLSMSAPEAVTLTAFAADGTALTTADVALEWTRVGGSAQCGGPAVAGPVDLPIPG